MAINENVSLPTVGNTAAENCPSCDNYFHNHVFMPPRPAFNMHDEFYKTIATVNNTLAKVIALEEQLTHKVDCMLSNVTSDNVEFKKLMTDSYNQFANTVKNEVNSFESLITNSYEIFQKTMEAEFADNVEAFNDFRETVRQMVADFEEHVNLEIQNINLYFKNNFNTTVAQEIRKLKSAGELAEIMREDVFVDVLHADDITDLATKAELDIERKRINAMAKLGEGSTSADAELMDIRTGGDGKTYTNAGEAVRGQYASAIQATKTVNDEVARTVSGVQLEKAGFNVHAIEALSNSNSDMLGIELIDTHSLPIYRDNAYIQDKDQIVEDNNFKIVEYVVPDNILQVGFVRGGDLARYGMVKHSDGVNATLLIPSRVDNNLVSLCGGNGFTSVLINLPKTPGKGITKIIAYKYDNILTPNNLIKPENIVDVNHYVYGNTDSVINGLARYKVDYDPAYTYYYKVNKAGVISTINCGQAYDVNGNSIGPVNKVIIDDYTAIMKIPDEADYIIVNVSDQSESHPVTEVYREAKEESDVLNNVIVYNAPFKGKTAAFFGDSIVAGYVNSSTSFPDSFAKIFSDKVGFIYSNYGVAGSMFVAENGSIVDKIKETNLSGYKYLFIAGGINDVRNSVPISDFKTALDDLGNYLDDNYNGFVTFIAPINCCEDGINNDTVDAYRMVIKNTCLKYEFSFINGGLFDFPLVKGDASNEVISDGLHPTSKGHRLYGNQLTNVFVNAGMGSYLTLDSDQAIDLANGTDFNTLTDSNTYKVTTWSSGVTMINSPNANSGRLIVLRTSEWGRVIQIYIANTSKPTIYIRNYDTNWSEWVTLVTSDVIDETTLTHYLSLESDDAKVIPNGTDFNSLTAPGNFKITTWSSGSTMINSPNANSGRLIVMRNSEWATVIQIYIANTDEGYIYIRKLNTEWSEWESLATSKDIAELRAKIDYPGYPTYYEDYLAEKIQKINGDMMGMGINSGDAFIFITDTHENPTYTVETIKHVCDLTNINKIVHGGDSANDKASKVEALSVINKNYNRYLLPGRKLFKIVGNHEFNNGGASEANAYKQLSESDLFTTIIGDNANGVTYDPSGSLSYYFDNEVQKIRYFVCSVNYKSTMNLDGLKWIVEELVNVPVDFDVVVMCHHGINDNGYTYYAPYLIEALDAFKLHGVYEYTLSDKVYDFTGKQGDVICTIFGDEHRDISMTSVAGIPVIATTCADYSREEGGLTRTLGTTNEGAYDVVVINKITRTVKLTRIGAGEDRTFTY